ncbi:MAG: aconitase X catalytic domain-containing protein [Acidimicrobiales bacterium]|nr:aconitase X catalytic domain-containing protein [Acidimicrobiales bacterium]
MRLTLTDADQAMLAGERGDATAMAMRVVTRVADTMEAAELLSIEGAHIDSCLYLGQAGLDFARALAAGGAQVCVPTTLNVSSLDLLHPDLYRGDADAADDSRALMTLYEDMGCRPTWTCAPYQLEDRPAFGQHVAWAESNAIVFANSVLGARTHRYGDFIDICSAITGRAPAAGLHLDANRRGEIVFRLVGVRDELLHHDALAPVLGSLVGHRAGARVPVIVGLPPEVPEHRLKALGAAAASTGAVGLFHAVGITPEAPTLEAALGGRPPTATVDITPADLRAARDALSTTVDTSGPLGAVSLGTPHYSVTEFGRLRDALAGRVVSPDVECFVNTGRDVLHEISLRGWQAELEQAGVQIVTDTCTYITPIMADVRTYAMTDSAKWAHYAPGNLGIDVVFGSVDDCADSAVTGRLVFRDEMWADA